MSSGEIGERLSAAMVDKMIEAIKDIEIEFDSIVIEDIDSEVAKIITDAFKGDDVKMAIQKKIVETIQAVDPKEAAKKLEMTWGDLIGEFLYKLVNTFKPRK